jgi:23S rRNA (guanosine2251-2'-O)-methyltransferase
MRKIPNAELNRLSQNEFKEIQKTPIIIILDNVRSLMNVGSIFRTADAFLLEGIYLCGITGTPPQKEINKTALGATETVNWKYYSSTLTAIEEVKQLGYKVFSVEQVEKSILLHKMEPKQGEKIALVFGNEVDGIEQEVINASDGFIEVPQLGTKHSLNISVCAGIVVWEIFIKTKKWQNEP